MKRCIYNPFIDTSSLIRLCFITLFISGAWLQGTAQGLSPDKVVKGIVRFSEDNDVAAGVNIYLKGSTSTGTYSDASGKFEFPSLLKTGDVLIFSFIGRKTLEYVVPEQAVGLLQITMTPENIEMVEEPLTEGEPARASLLGRLFKFRDRGQ